MCVEMNREEMERYHAEHPNVLPVHIGSVDYGWRAFLMDPHEVTRLEILEKNLSVYGTENYKYINYVSKITSIPSKTIECVSLQTNELLIVMPIVYL